MSSTSRPQRNTSNAPEYGTRRSEHRAFARRARVFGTIIVLLFVCLVTRLWFLQIVHGDDYKQAAGDNEARRIRTPASRGIILDRNGIVLATNRSQFAVYAAPSVLKDRAVLERLAKLLHSTPDDITQTIEDHQQNRYDPLRIALDVPMEIVSLIEENRPFLPGVSTQPEPVRWYPRGLLAAHVIGTLGRIDEKEFKTRKALGYYSDDFLGRTGAEHQYENELHGQAGGIDVQVDAHGRKVRVVSTVAPSPGAVLKLTLDARVQAAAERVFRERHFTGAAVAIDPRTGAVLAMASAPQFDPDLFATGITARDWAPIHADLRHPLINRAMDAMYAPGSTFKPIVAAAGLETGAISTGTTVNCPGAYYLGRARFGCWQTHGMVDFYEAIAKSCDVFFYIAGQKIGPDGMARYAKAFGLAEKTGIDLPGEDIGSIPSPSWKAQHYHRLGRDYSQWFGGDTLHMSIGQGDVLVTPLQMARVAAALANGGDILKPYLAARISDGRTGAVRVENGRTLLNHVPVSPENMEYVRRGMRRTVTAGTGRVVNFPEVAVAAKTGSAQTHGTAKTHGWFICFAPYDHPTIAIAAIVERGGHGADTAGKVARAMLQAYFKLAPSKEDASKSD